MKSVRVYPYRWVVLLALMLVILASEMQWLALAPVSRAAVLFYQGQIPADSFIGPDLFTLVYLVVFVVFSIPASFVIDRLGLKVTLRIGALAIAFFSLLKGFCAHRFWIVFVSQVGLSLAHPLVLNSVTTVTARWFPLRERGVAAGLVSFSQYLGLLLIMIIAPLAVFPDSAQALSGALIAPFLFWLGIATSVLSFSAAFLFREKPPTAASLEPFEHENFIDSFKLLFQKRHNMGGFIIVFGLIWGLFNAFIAKIDGIADLAGIEMQGGILGAILLGAGMVGSVIIPGVSDYRRKRKIYFFISTLGLCIGFIVFACMPLLDQVLENTTIISYLCAGVLGFFFLGAIPLGFQYAAELSYPMQEASAQGVLLLNGHFIGIIILLSMSLAGGRYIEQVLIASAALLFAATLAVLFISESPLIITEDERLREAARKESVHQR